MSDIKDERRTFVQTNLVNINTHHVPVSDEFADVSQTEACKDKGHAHPGSYIELADGQKVHMQYGASPLVERNGVTSTELLKSMINYFKVYQEGCTYKDGVVDIPAQPSMACHETGKMVECLEQAWLWSQARQLDRSGRKVQFKDKA